MPRAEAGPVFYSERAHKDVRSKAVEREEEQERKAEGSPREICVSSVLPKIYPGRKRGRGGISKYPPLPLRKNTWASSDWMRP